MISFWVYFSLILVTVQASLLSILIPWIYHKIAPSKTCFFPLFLLQKVTSTSEPILFSLQHAQFLFLRTIFYWILLNQLINLTLLHFSSSVFLQSLKISYMHFINKTVPAKRDETFIEYKIKWLQYRIKCF